MAEREHFTNGRVWAFGTGFGVIGLAFGAQVSAWTHWISIGCGYGAGGALVLGATVLISKSYYTRHPVLPAPKEDPSLVMPPSQPALPSPSPPDPHLDIFTPAQIEILQLAKDIRTFLAEFEPLPERIDPLSNSTEKQRHERIYQRAAWRERLISAYELRFGDRTRITELKLGERNMSVNHEVLREKARATEEYFKLYADVLVAMAHRIEGVVLDPRGIQ